ncbi:MAG: iron-containing alcohol dehydrogenase [Clostridia bacterium]|nr:iron-containing alcohol dehydrogenase [Clostridia bacterium]
MENTLSLPIDRSVFTPDGQPVWQFGCRRYIQTSYEKPGDGILYEAGNEIARLGKRAFIIGGPTALALTRDLLSESLNKCDISAKFITYGGHCSPDTARKMETGGYDVIVRVGGGRIMDMSKLIGYFSHLPVVNIPTSCATCAAVSSLSVLYNDDGQTIGTLCYDKSVDSVIVDTALIAAAPHRLTAAGVLDAMAKHIEIEHYFLSDQSETQKDPGLLAARVLAGDNYLRLIEACQNNGNLAADANILYRCIPLTGVISGLSRGRNQSNLGHGLYEEVRRHFTSEGANALHGELVAIGLFLQLAYDQASHKISALRDFMRSLGMPVTLDEMGISGTPEQQDKLFHAMCNSPYFIDTLENRKKLALALTYVWKEGVCHE